MFNQKYLKTQENLNEQIANLQDQFNNLSLSNQLESSFSLLIELSRCLLGEQNVKQYKQNESNQFRESVSSDQTPQQQRNSQNLYKCENIHKDKKNCSISQNYNQNKNVQNLAVYSNTSNLKYKQMGMKYEKMKIKLNNFIGKISKDQDLTQQKSDIQLAQFVKTTMFQQQIKQLQKQINTDYKKRSRQIIKFGFISIRLAIFILKQFQEKYKSCVLKQFEQILKIMNSFLKQYQFGHVINFKQRNPKAGQVQRFDRILKRYLVKEFCEILVLVNRTFSNHQINKQYLSVIQLLLQTIKNMKKTMKQANQSQSQCQSQKQGQTLKIHLPLPVKLLFSITFLFVKNQQLQKQLEGSLFVNAYLGAIFTDEVQERIFGLYYLLEKLELEQKISKIFMQTIPLKIFGNQIIMEDLLSQIQNENKRQKNTIKSKRTHRTIYYSLSILQKVAPYCQDEIQICLNEAIEKSKKKVNVVRDWELVIQMLLKYKIIKSDFINTEELAKLNQGYEHTMRMHLYENPNAQEITQKTASERKLRKSQQKKQALKRRDSESTQQQQEKNIKKPKFDLFAKVTWTFNGNNQPVRLRQKLSILELSKSKILESQKSKIVETFSQPSFQKPELPLNKRISRQKQLEKNNE